MDMNNGVAARETFRRFPKLVHSNSQSIYLYFLVFNVITVVSFQHLLSSPIWITVRIYNMVLRSQSYFLKTISAIPQDNELCPSVLQVGNFRHSMHSLLRWFWPIFLAVALLDPLKSIYKQH